MERSSSPIKTKAHCKEIPWWASGWVSTFPLQMAQVQSLVGQVRSCKLCAAKSLQSCPTLCDPIDGSPSGSSVPGILQARVGCHFLFQCMKVKSEREVSQSCPTLSDPIDYSPPGSSTHGIFLGQKQINSVH